MQEIARNWAAQTGARLMVTDDIDKGVKDVDFVRTDVWVSMGEPKEVWAERDQAAHALPGQRGPDEERPATPTVKFMHCLPAFHNTETKVGQDIFEKFGIKEMEVTEEVFDGAMNVAFEQAENGCTPSRRSSSRRWRGDAMTRIVVALGGNALLKRGEALTASNQRRNARTAAEALAPLLRSSSPTATARRSGCWRCRRSRIRARTRRSTCSGPRPRG